MGARTIPTDCPTCGLVVDWGDFGPDPHDGTVGAECRCCNPSGNPEASSRIKAFEDAARRLIAAWPDDDAAFDAAFEDLQALAEQEP